MGNIKTINGVQTVETNAAIMSNALTAFTIFNGPILLTHLLAICKTDNDGTASTLLYYADPTDGALTNLCAVSGSLANLVAGNIVNITGTLADNAVITLKGVAISQAGDIVIPEGIIALTIGTGSTTGKWIISMGFKPLTPSASVTAAY